uniref:Ferric-chelate reductase 1-like n=1 Tax=Dermatophagoides pteronyssinus TaxID=6956 RepID=A0A6P6YN14_DERPT
MKIIGFEFGFRRGDLLSAMFVNNHHRVIILSFAVVIFLILSYQSVNGRRNGAPIESCTSLKPNHGQNIQSQPKSTNPFLFNITLYPYMNDEEFVHIEIYTPDDNHRTVFRGFIVQARMANDQTVIADGQFVPMDSNQTRSFSCNNMEGNNTWTHSNNSPKQRVSAFWFPTESTMNNEIIFLATVAIDAKHYWLEMESVKIPLGVTINGGGGGEEEQGEGGEGEVEGGGGENPSNEQEESDEENSAEQQQQEPSNNVESIVSSSTFTINYNSSTTSNLILII